MGGKSEAPPPPDYTPIANASKEAAAISAEVAQQQLAWAKEQYFLDRDVSDSVIEAALGRLDQTDAQAQADRARYEDIFQPLEDDLAWEAREYANPERMESEAGKAQADVSQQFEMARTAAQDRLESYGIDPSQTRAGALDVSTRMQEAAARAGAGNQARQQVENTGRALREQAINVGKGYPAQIQGAYNTATQSGNAGVNAGIATTSTGAGAMGNPTQWQGQSTAALGTWGNALNMGYENALGAYKAEQSSSSGVGSILGLVGGIGTKLLGFEDGGAVPMDGAPHQGIPVDEGMSPSRGAAIDDVPARLNAGEFVMPKEAVEWIGHKQLYQMIGKAKQEAGALPAEVGAGPDVRMAPAQAPQLNTAALPV